MVQINDNLWNQAVTLFNYWFLQFDFPDKDDRPYKTSGGEMHLNRELNLLIPSDWDVIRIGDICDCRDSERIPLSSIARQEMPGEYPYYGATEIMDSINQYIFDDDLVLIAEDGSIMDKKGHPVLQRVSGKCWINNHAHILQPKEGYSCFLLYMILKDIPVVKIKTGSIQAKITKDNLMGYKTFSIPLEKRQRFIELTEPIDRKILEIQAENNYLNKLRNWILPMIMNGQAIMAD